MNLARISRFSRFAPRSIAAQAVRLAAVTTVAFGVLTAGTVQSVRAEALAGSADMVVDGVALDALEAALLDRTNADRAANGLPPVALDVTTLGVARQRAADQVPLPGLSHYNGASNLAFVPMLADAGAGYWLAGENLARLTATGSSGATADVAGTSLMNSPLHRKNILEPTFNLLSIGVAVDPFGRIIFAEIFRAA